MYGGGRRATPGRERGYTSTTRPTHNLIIFSNCFITVLEIAECGEFEAGFFGEEIMFELVADEAQF